MPLTLYIHIAAGALGLVSGFIALYAAKGARLHRRSGTLFVYAMLTMCGCGIAIAAVRGVAPALNIPAAVLTACLVVTSLTTLRPRTAASARLETVAMCAAAAVAAATLTFGFEAIAAGGKRYGMPAFPFFMFGSVALIAVAGDLRVMRGRALEGGVRIARHLWRMSFALFIAAMSFFIGQAKVIPKPIRIMPVLALPVVAVLATMCYWLWRVRRTRARHPVAILRAREAV